MSGGKQEAWPDGFVYKIPDWHFLARLRERYGIVLRPGELDQIKNKIKRGEMVRRGNIRRPRKDNDETVYVTLRRSGDDGQPEERIILLCYHPRTGGLITALTMQTLVTKSIKRSNRIGKYSINKLRSRPEDKVTARNYDSRDED